jgi:hypothetical protein
MAEQRNMEQPLHKLTHPLQWMTTYITEKESITFISDAILLCSNTETYCKISINRSPADWSLSQEYERSRHDGHVAQDLLPHLRLSLEWDKIPCKYDTCD